MIIETLDYFKMYREKVALVKEIGIERNRIIEQMNSLDMKRELLNSEINDIQRIITHCIDTGMSPTEVKLKTEPDQRGNIWSRF